MSQCRINIKKIIVQQNYIKKKFNFIIIKSNNKKIKRDLTLLLQVQYHYSC
jgi:hypothetical protein